MKNPLHSKAFWLNAVTTAIGIITLAAQMPELTAYLPWLMLLSGSLNIVLRVFFTALPTSLATASTKRTARQQRRKDDAPKVVGNPGKVVAPELLSNEGRSIPAGSADLDLLKRVGPE